MLKKSLILIILLFPILAFAENVEFPDIEGWQRDGEVKTYNRDNLFERIDGASEFYFSYAFEKLYVAEYKKGESELTIEIYDQHDPVHAYGIYSMERPASADTKSIGLEGYYDDATLNFTTGKYYVKMNTYQVENAGESLLTNVAQQLAPTLCKNPELPAQYSAFPNENRVPHSQQYVSTNFMGLSMLGSAFRAKYSGSEGDFTLFIIHKKDKEAAAETIKKYQEFSQAETIRTKEGEYTIDDPFNGTIYLLWKGNYLVGASGKVTAEKAFSLAEKAMAKLKLE